MKRQLEDRTGKLHREVGKRLLRKANKPVTPEELVSSDEALVQTEKCEDLGVHEEAKTSDWAPEEDQLILKEADNGTSANWKSICKKLNRSFKAKHRTALDCKLRWDALTSSSPLQSHWTQQNDLLLLLAYYRAPGDWAAIAPLFEPHTDLRARVSSFLLDTAKRAKEERYEDLAQLTPLCKLQLLVSVDLMMGHGVWTPEVIEVMQQTQIEEEHCVELMKALGKLLRPGAVWDKSTLDGYLASAIEKLQNRINATTQGSDTMDDIMHVRQITAEAPQPEAIGSDPRIQYVLVPMQQAAGAAAEYYVVALCYVRPQQL